MRRIFNNPFEMEGSWCKGNLHTHTTYSDGTKSREQVVNLYGDAGYDFISITDHGLLTPIDDLQNKGLLLIPGEEICVGCSEVGSFFHIVGVDISEKIPITDFDRDVSPQRAIDLIRSIGGEALIAHPYWSGLNFNDLKDLKGYIGVEIYNTSCEIERNIGISAVHIDGLLAVGKKTLVFATDDHHGDVRSYRPLDACIAWINVRAKRLDSVSIMSSIKNGCFYSSTGPEIKNVKIIDEGIVVETSPVKSISFVSIPSMGEKFTALDEGLTSIIYPGRREELYLRIEATDYQGRKAWTNPIYNYIE